MIVQISTIYLAVNNSYTYLLSFIVLMGSEGVESVFIPIMTLSIFGMIRGPEVYGIM